MKNKITVLLALALCLCFAVSSCGAEVSVLEGFCFATRDFDLDAAGKYVADGTEKYFGKVLDFAGELSAAQNETAKKIFSKMAFSAFEEDGGVCTVTVKYINFAKLIKNVENDVVTGSTATQSLERLLEGGRFEMQFMDVAENVKVTLSSSDGKSCIVLGYSGANAEFTELLGLDTFLSWYSAQR